MLVPSIKFLHSDSFDKIMQWCHHFSGDITINDALGVNIGSLFQELFDGLNVSADESLSNWSNTHFIWFIDSNHLALKHISNTLLFMLFDCEIQKCFTIIV